MNETVSKILAELDQYPLHFAFAYAEQNDRGEDILVFSCRELPLRDLIYVPGKKDVTLGWDTERCPLAPAILAEFRRYWQEEAHWKVNEILEDIASYRERLAGELSRLGLRVIPGEANYLLFWSPVPLAGPLRERGILLRDCANYHGLCEGWYRTAVRTGEENARLLAALEDIVKEGTP